MRILIADDEAATRDFLKVALRGDGHKVEMAENGAMAWSAFSSGDAFDLVLSDISMPEMDGIELADKILAANPATKIILMSGLDSEIARVEALKVRGVSTLSKPFSLEQVRAAVKSS